MGALPDHVPSFKHFLVLIPTNTKPELHEYEATLPGLFPLSFTAPLAGLASLGQMTFLSSKLNKITMNNA